MLCHSDFMKGKPSVVIMEAITEQEEQRIDKSSKYYGSIVHTRNDGYVVPSKDIFLYGEVDFDNEDDLRSIERYELIDSEYDAINWIHSNFDFEKGCFTTVDGIAKGYPTWDTIKWFMYKYTLLGKPQRVIVYRCPKSMIVH